jgi:YebC/PmpR family DNA-binding regulatory protein
MSGHSKWATIKRKKAATDSARGATFSRIIREITIAARAGGGDPSANVRLRSAIDAAKAANMPGANIERAVQRGTGEVEGATYEEITYEGYGPNGVAFLVDTATDNRNRTANEIRNLFSKNGGNLAEAGAVGWMFEPRGVIEVARDGRGEDALLELAVEAGAEDVDFAGDGASATVTTAPTALDAVRRELVARGVTIVSAELAKIATTTVELDEKAAAMALRLFDLLEGQDDVQKVHANFQIPDDVLAKLAP